jgi:hypothetical protein
MHRISISHILGHEFFKYGVQIVWHHGMSVLI